MIQGIKCVCILYGENYESYLAAELWQGITVEPGRPTNLNYLDPGLIDANCYGYGAGN